MMLGKLILLILYNNANTKAPPPGGVLLARANTLANTLSPLIFDVRGVVSLHQLRVQCYTLYVEELGASCLRHGVS